MVSERGLQVLRAIVQDYVDTREPVGSKAIAEHKSGGDYTPMLREIVAFFHTGKPPVSPELTLEIYAFMEAADESIRQGGTPISIPEYLRKNGWEK